jgi:hypothetical protein
MLFGGGRKNGTQLKHEKWDTIETCEISGSQVGEYEDDVLLGYSAV